MELGFSDQQANGVITRFVEHDRDVIERQRAVIHDDSAFRQSAMDATEELKQLFADDKSAEKTDSS